MPSPRWYGFNLPDMFLGPGDLRWAEMIRNPPGRFNLDELRWIAELGFNFVRLPLAYTWWASVDDPFTIRDDAFAPLDEAIEAGRSLGLHVCVALHHAPGFCINTTPQPERFNLWADDDARACFAHHWATLARRYQAIDTRSLSFDLVNEPARCDEAQYERAARAAIDAIRAVSPQRTIVSDGLDCGNRPSFSLADTGVIQSCRGYKPGGLTHYLAWWAGMPYARPDWPMPMPDGSVFGPDELWDSFADWRRLMDAHGVGVHCGEFGCHHRTPHRIMLAWCEAQLDCFDRMGIGFALWNFRGSFGVLDSSRSDVDYVDFKHLPLDRELLHLLQRYNRA